MAVTDLWVADEITQRLGKPTVEALARRIDIDGRCFSCGLPLGPGRVSLRAQPIGDLVELTAHHASCTPSEWLSDSGIIQAAAGSTYAAVTAALEFQKPDEEVPRRGLLSSLRAWWRRAHRTHPIGLMIVNPSIDTVHVRMAGPGESVDADMEMLRRIGFHEASANSVVHAPVPGVFSLLRRGQITVQTPAGTWEAPVSEEIEQCIRRYQGLLVMPTTEISVRSLQPHSPVPLLDGLACGQVLFAWAPLLRGPDERPGAPLD
ncbi:hypothetical protein C3Y87_04995 [Carbonactinospora thermoautotrophica]|uniref:Uncharacterized protein n=1 Tax=Carbonactinospora thermoautotrophica TaxID=1469144 RepID=A0A132MRE5_9ACTN|nr:hypothetical protein [Carbonactinospora thermoautotrophica]KWX00316.1 hypothetical protein TH66_15905 [Carbonactinospora thermoautotrophica]KWX01604.1 hypothetical protein LI90_2636 [Carbonactinospora thermoautotrophica]KWX07849.1 hypothetical protein TR74_17350 [Carbonactinospora thermoautotrophica]MCX9190778.1 hypothetical protein [Carbonactinospora thermoautotrophica]